MKTITEHEINQSFDRFNAMPPNQAQEFMQRVSQNQPAVLAYLMTMDACFEKEEPPEENEGQLFFAGLVILNILLEHQPKRPMVTMEEIEAAEEANGKLLLQMDEGPAMDLDARFLTMTRNYNQAPLFLFASELLFSGLESEAEIDDDIALAALKIKTVIDCFEQPAARA